MTRIARFLSAATAVAGLSLALALSASGGEDAGVAKAFQEECAKKVAAAPTMTVPGRDGWLFLKGELRHLAAGEFWGPAAEKTSVATQADAKDPLAAVVHYKEQLDKLGIELILLPVPPKSAVYPDMLSDAVGVKEGAPFPRVDADHRELFRLLAGKGVKVVDLVPEFAAHRADEKGPVYCKTDTHWSGLACILAARAVAAEFKDRPWMKDVPKARFESEEKTVAIRGDLVDALKGQPGAKADPEPEKVLLRFVGTRGATALEPVKTDPASPVLLISDSHGLVFHIGEDLFARGAGLPDQLAFELGFPVDVISSRGDGVTKVRIDLYQRAKSDPKWLAGKKAIVWCFSSRDFTQCSNGWRKLPVKKGG